jgi:hypothetical protein
MRNPPAVPGSSRASSYSARSPLAPLPMVEPPLTGMIVFWPSLPPSRKTTMK